MVFMKNGWKTALSVIEHTLERCLDLTIRKESEFPELSSIGWLLAWMIPVTMYSDYFLTSPYLVSVGTKVGRNGFIVISLTVLLYQLIGLVFGGLPSAFIKTEEQKRSWMRFRRIGLIVGIVVWGAMSYLLTVDRVSVGTTGYAWLAISCGLGAFKLTVEIRASEKQQAMRKENVIRITGSAERKEPRVLRNLA